LREPAREGKYERMAKKRIYRISFRNEGEVYQVYCKQVSQGGLFGFVEIDGFLFGEKSTLVVDPSEETLKREFAGVGRAYIPLHSVIRIDEVEQRGTSSIRSVPESSKVTSITPIYTPTKRDR
jgi:hypothetical protein